MKYAILKNKVKVKEGDWVEFKADIEQYGKIINIKGTGKNAMLTLVSDNTYGFDGGYLKNETEVCIEAKRCFPFEDD